ncbi:MAG TPA: LacI family DNA-binding transcriptional regulator [Dermatophilaceae bacterium]|jgi:LacI family transcriptional regulator
MSDRPGKTVKGSPVAATGWDVARQAGVSQTTVSRAFRTDPRVKPATRDRILATAREMGYLPNLGARSLITRRTGVIGVVVADLTNPLYPEMISTMHEVLVSAGYRMMLIRDDKDAAGGPDLDPLRGRAVDGVIFASATSASPVVAEFLAAGMPVVLLNRDVENVQVDRLLPDDESACSAAVDHLVALGHREIASLTGPSETVSGEVRSRYITEGLARHGITVPTEWLRSGNYSHDDGKHLTLEILSCPKRPTAIVCANDTMAFGALDAAGHLGVRVPEDLSVTGIDDVAMSAWSMISLTTVALPKQDMARQAVETILARIDGASGPAQRILYPVELVLRSSTASPRPG